MAELRLTLFINGSDEDIDALDDLTTDDDRLTEMLEGIAEWLGKLVSVGCGGKRYYQVETPPPRLELPDVPEWR